MPKILIKEFADIATASGIPKLNKIKKEKYKPAYQPAQDFYKQLREAIIKSHEKGYGNDHIIKTANACNNPDKKPKFEALAKAYVRWNGSTKKTWDAPPRQLYSSSGVDVLINPELCFVAGAMKRLVKLYFNQEAMTQTRANYILYLMAITNGANYSCTVLDIKRRKLFKFTGDPSQYAISCTAELAGIASVWPTI